MESLNSEHGSFIFFKPIHLLSLGTPCFPNNRVKRSERAAECFLPTPLARKYTSRMGPSTLGTALLGFLAVIVSHLDPEKCAKGIGRRLELHPKFWAYQFVVEGYTPEVDTSSRAGCLEWCHPGSLWRMVVDVCVVYSSDGEAASR